MSLFVFRYINPIGIGLVLATGLSALANLAHAVEFGRQLKIFSEWGIPEKVYAVAFGGILPFVSLTFARVLSNVVETEDGPNPELVEANNNNHKLRRELKETEQRLRIAETEKIRAEDRFAAMGDLVKYLFSEDKRQRILFVRDRWPALNNSAIAILSESSPSHVSEVLKEYNGVEDILQVENHEEVSE